MGTIEHINNKKSYSTFIWSLSIIIPVAVAILIFLPQKLIVGTWVYMLPHVNAIFNSVTAVALFLGYIFIKNKNVKLHRLMMTIAFSLGSLFLVSYIIYHAAADSTIFGDSNGNGMLDEIELTNSLSFWRPIYVGILLSHIALAAIVVPFVLFAIYFALTEKIEKHKKIVKFTFPIWLYVSVTGVVVYFLISPFYSH
ncbi:MAG: putative membrane protein [Marivirga sp.]|jgi:putative membrane protein